MPPTHIALVTGGSRGIGAAIAQRLARAGAGVVVAARDLAACEETCQALRSSGAWAAAVPLDLAEPSSIVEAAARAREACDGVGPLDWLVNNAGMVVSAPAFGHLDSEDDPFERHLAVNFHGARRLTELLVPAMVEAGYGRVVNVASSAGLRGYAYVSAYCASKHALLGYTRALGDELAKSGVAIGAVCPHYVESPMLDAGVERIAAKTGRSSEEARAFFRDQNPGGRLIEPDEVASVVLELLEGERGGRIVELDGGPPKDVA